EEAAVTKKSISLQVTIGFKSSHPISFKTQLTFRDGSGAQTAVTVMATADNCLLTTHAFSLLKYRAQTDATTHACDTIQYNHVEFVKRSSSVTNLLASDDAAAKSGLERRVMKSQTSLSVSSLAGRQNSSFISHTKNSKYLKLPWQSIPEFPCRLQTCVIRRTLSSKSPNRESVDGCFVYSQGKRTFVLVGSRSGSDFCTHQVDE
ncbi:uncharacterized protein LOC120356630, partial [Nilaparvata lugens]|uniref:uncharacterized protein LOC120356630 n=1 Tax=Nilaparvata lugens TaxID=108931 RepID=UPI00193CC08E